MRSLFEMLRPEPAQASVMDDLVEAAHKEWEAAQVQFNEVRDNDLVDHAIYRLQAAERHYVYLLRLCGRDAERSRAEVTQVESAEG